MATVANPGQVENLALATSSQVPQSPCRYMVQFGVPADECREDNKLPSQLVELLVYIAHEGVTTTDLFRRQGNMTDVAVILGEFAAGHVVNFNNYTFYTLASVVKIPGGLFGRELEAQLLSVLDLKSRLQQYEVIQRAIGQLAPSTQHLLTLLLGIWFRMVNHSEYNTMSSEAVAVSVASCLFHVRGRDARHKERAVQLLQILIDDFSMVQMLGRENVRYFAEITRTRVNRPPAPRRNVSSESPLVRSTLPLEGNKYAIDDACTYDTVAFDTSSPRLRRTTIEIQLPDGATPFTSEGDQENEAWNQPQLSTAASVSAPEVNQAGTSPCRNLLSTDYMHISTSLNRIDNVRKQQLIRMKKRSSWFLTPTGSVDPHDDVMTRSFEVHRKTLGAASPFRSLAMRDSIISSGTLEQDESSLTEDS